MSAMGNVALLLIAVAASDPVPGFRLYFPKLGEVAVVHWYEEAIDNVVPEVGAWVSAESLSKFQMQMYETIRSSQEIKKADPDDRADIESRLADGSKKAAEKRGDRLKLADMTKIKVIASGTFNRLSESRFIRSDDVPSFPDHYFVEVLNGAHKGKKVWISCFAVRVPGAKDPFERYRELMTKLTDKTKSPPPSTQDEESPAIDQQAQEEEKPRVQLVDSTWTRKGTGAYFEVSCTVKNVSRMPLANLKATIVYKDRAGKLVTTSTWHVGTLAYGDSKTFSVTHESDANIDSYSVDFEAQLGYGFVHVEKVSPDVTPKAAKSVRGRRPK